MHAFFGVFFDAPAPYGNRQKGQASTKSRKGFVFFFGQVYVLNRAVCKYVFIERGDGDTDETL